MSHRFLLAILLSLITAEISFAQTTKKYALLVGVAKYDHAEMSPLEFPEADAKSLGELLKSGGYDVEVLLGSQATQKAIRDRLEGLNKKGNAEGVVVVGLFGHGVEIPVRDAKNQTVRDETGKDVTEGCFCPFDTEIRFVRDANGKTVSGNSGKPLTEPDPDTLVKLADLMTSLSIAKARNRVVFADCCRNIPNAARDRSFGASFKAKDLPENTSVLFGCSPRQKAFEHRDWGHGAFTKCLLEELPRLSSQGKVTMGTLIDRLQVTVPELVASVSTGETQTPVPFFTNTVDLQLASLPETRSGFDGTKAGDRKVLAEIAFRWCPAGTFTMGTPGATRDESPVQVTLTKGFWLAEAEITQGQWQRLMGTTPWKGQENVKEGNDYAASYISHDDAVEYCQKLTNQERGSGRMPQGWKYSLPTEAQWEYACRAGTMTKYSFGESESQLGEYGWFKKNVDAGEKYAHRVGQKKPNPWGLKDMHGNLAEWCSDWYNEKLSGGRDPQGPSPSSVRVSRGGSWFGYAFLCTSADRFNGSPGFRGSFVGFRLAAVPE